jgi:hypothetical protein
MDNLEGLCRSHASLVICQPVQSTQHRLGLIISKQLLSDCLCVLSSRVWYLSKTDLLSGPCLICLVTTANVRINSTNILTAISIIAGVGLIFV